MATNVKSAYEQTNIQQKMTELVSFNVGELDLQCYLSLLEGESASTLKLINVGLKDEHINTILDWIWNKKVECLVLTCNRLTDNCLQMFQNRSLPNLRELYLGKNRISKYRMKENIVELRSKFTLYL